jgi:hypothetical protein
MAKQVWNEEYLNWASVINGLRNNLDVIAEVVSGLPDHYATAAEIRDILHVTPTVLKEWARSGKVRKSKTSRRKGAWVTYATRDVMKWKVADPGRKRS